MFNLTSIYESFAYNWLSWKEHFSKENDKKLGNYTKKDVPFYNNPMDLFSYVFPRLIYRSDKLDSYTSPLRAWSIIQTQGDTSSISEFDCDDFANLFAYLLKNIKGVSNIKLANVIDQNITMSHVLCQFDYVDSKGQFFTGIMDTNGLNWWYEHKVNKEDILKKWSSIYENAKYITVVYCDPVEF